MDDLIFQIVETAVMVCVLILFRYVIPWVRQSLYNIKYERVVKEFSTLVYAVQERYKDKEGAEKRQIVTDKIKELLKTMNVNLKDEQIRELNDAAVMAMRIAKETEETK